MNAWGSIGHGGFDRGTKGMIAAGSECLGLPEVLGFPHRFAGGAIRSFETWFQWE
jgi:hypothetical protein